MARHRWDPVAPKPRELFRPVRIDPSGREGPTRWQAAASQAWVRTSRGLYVPSYVDRSVPEQRILEQSARAPADAVVTGWAACRLHGGGFFDGLDNDLRPIPVPVNVGPRGYLAGDGEVSICYGKLAAEDLAVRHGIPTVVVTRATFDAMRLAGEVREAVVVLDMMAAAGRVSRLLLARYAGPRATAREPHLLEAVGLSSEHAKSPMETRLRLIWVLDAELPAPYVNCDVLDLEGNLLGEVDLLDPETGTAAEFDGADHRRALRQAADVAKEQRLRDAGLEVARVTGPDMNNADLVVRRLLAARARAARVPATERRWVARPKTHTLHERLLDQLRREEEHERWLAQRRGSGEVG
jgi:hypothetical protein